MNARRRRVAPFNIGRGSVVRERSLGAWACRRLPDKAAAVSLFAINIGTTERVVRILLGVALLALGITTAEAPGRV
jgi:hypothetical protein